MKRLPPYPHMLVLCAAAALSACSATPVKQDVAAAPPDKDVVCEREVKLGTLFPKVKCRTAQQIEAERADAAAFGDAVSAHPSLPQQVGK